MVVVIGAGVAGLAAARALVAGGREVVVLDKGRGVGGRCATRRIDGQAFDHGVAWFHGDDTGFLASFDGLEPGELIEGWPRRILGDGPPCNPSGLSPRARRFALASGATAYPKQLAVGLDVRLGARVTALAASDRGVEVEIDGAPAWTAHDVVLTAPPEQAAALLGGLRAPAVDATRFLLDRVSTVACLTILALYDAGAPELGFDVVLPEVGGPVALIANEASKRVPSARPALTIQATPAWSRRHLEESPERWGEALLAAAAAHVGSWVTAPRARELHRWRFARVRPPAWRAPVLLPVGRARLALAGDAFDEGAGVQGAYLAGQRAAALLLERS